MGRVLAVEEIRQLKARYSQGARRHGQRFLPALSRLGVRRLWRGSAMHFHTQTSCHQGHTLEVMILGAVEEPGITAMEGYILGPGRKTDLFYGAGHFHESCCFEEGAWRIVVTRLTRVFSHLVASAPD